MLGCFTSAETRNLGPNDYQPELAEILPVRVALREIRRRWLDAKRGSIILKPCLRWQVGCRMRVVTFPGNRAVTGPEYRGLVA